MSRHTRSYSSIAVLLAIAAALLALPVGSARAETFGGLGVSSPVAESPEEGGASNHLDAGGPVGFAAEPLHGGYYTADTWLKAGKRHLRVQAFSAAGTFEREAPGPVGHGIEIPLEDSVGGLAVDPSAKRVYVLLTTERPEDAEARQNVKTDEAKLAEEKKALEEAKAKKETEREAELEGHITEIEGKIATEKSKFVFDAGQPAAAALFAFSASTLEPAAGTGAGGLLTGEAALKPREEEPTRDFAVLDPHGITVEPGGDVMVLGQQDVAKGKEEPASLRAAVQRIHTASQESLGPRYVDEKNCLDGGVAGDTHCSGTSGEPSSPMVLHDGTLLAVRVHALWSLRDAEKATETFSSVKTAKAYEAEPTWMYALPGSDVSLPAETTATGDQAQLVETGEHTGRVYLTGRAKSNAPVIVVLGYKEEGSSTTFSELGWTGDSSGHCAVPGQAGVLAAGSNAGADGEGLLLSVIAAPPSVAVTRFGTGGEACVHATLTPIGVAVEGGEPMSLGSPEEVAVVAGKKITFSSTMEGADALFGAWTFQNLDGRKQPPASPFEFKEGQISTSDTFSQERGKEETGRYLVTLEAQPDDFEPVRTRQLYVVVGMRVSFTSLRSVPVGEPMEFHVKVVDPYEPSTPSLTYKWRFGDGSVEETSSSTQLTFEHVFSKAGNYEPFLEVVDHGEHRAAAVSTGITVTAPGSPPPSSTATAGSKPVNPPVVKPVFTTRLSNVSIVVSKKGRLSLKLSCAATSGFCKGRIVLKTQKAFLAANGKHKKKSILTLAHAPFDIPAGHTATIALRLTRKARSLLSKKHKLQATGLLTTEQSSGQPLTTRTTLTLRLARRG